MKHRTFCRALAWALALVMALSALPFAALAEGTEQPQAGQVTPKTEEPKQEPPAPKAEDNKGEEPKAEDNNGEEPKAGEPNRENKDEAPNQEANAETPKPRSEGGAGAQDAETVTIPVKIRVDDKHPTTAWHVWVYGSDGSIARQLSSSEVSSYQDMTFTLPKLPGSFAQYNVKVSVNINGEDVSLKWYVKDGQNSLFSFYTGIAPGNTTFSGNGVFNGSQCEVRNAQELVSNAVKSTSTPYEYGTGDLTIHLSETSYKPGLYHLEGLVDVYGAVHRYKNLSFGDTGIDLCLTGLSGKLYVFTEDGAPISTDPTSGTYYTSDSTTLELHNFQEGRYQFRSFENPVTVTFDGSGGTVSQGSVTVESGATLNLSAFTASRFGYHFKGWSQSQDGDSVGGSFTPTEGTTLYALWDPVKITVYDSGTGSIFSYSPERQGTAIKDHPDIYAEFYWGCSDEQGKIWTTFDFSEDRELTVRYFKLFLNGINEQGTDKPWLVTGAPELRDSFPYTGLADLVTR